MLLSYCTNVHPAEDFDGVIRQLREYAGPIRRTAARDILGVGLWLPANLARQLAGNAEDRQALREVLDEEGLQLHTINAFPYGGFHNEVVKLEVYKPTWAQRERLEYTMDCAEVLAAFLPEGTAGSISTLPLAWREPWSQQDDDAATSAFAELSSRLRQLRERTGKTVRIAVEPEPGCVLDTVADVVTWLGARIPRGIDPEFVGLCVDTCHLAVSFADPAGAVRQIDAAGLRIVKVQASAALHVTDPAEPAAREALAAFVEPRYLHQVRESQGAGVIAADDLSDALADLPGQDPWRVHFHIPLHHVPQAPLETTVDVLRRTVAEIEGLAYAPEVHLDIETYTWSVLPGASVGITDGIAAEIAWAEANLLGASASAAASASAPVPPAVRGAS
ncbi:metabolite traffic protein EboE [Pseudarthrobacter sp. J75]|uniref:metabolite traffic protein EboE n=1 Tax=unclassified Pseudarthrobacter TaxID=2647000 RepID=UPI002E80540D|nr:MULTISPECIES: metabolite traffic protein EboE [unclassified Pseudarthrobacter]MEE2521913.1 metabolite traffic protein EboE [Pseudarthrobacter sp. J47]MEE2528838.1 metabolite traffic protein EboE [Pseudarthrobacter sp. J75]MEE2569965.1 metabolite traffic protein EboE [Pseudarthrobacter sp. J64]